MESTSSSDKLLTTELVIVKREATMAEVERVVVYHHDKLHRVFRSIHVYFDISPNSISFASLRVPFENNPPTPSQTSLRTLSHGRLGDAGDVH